MLLSIVLSYKLEKKVAYYVFTKFNESEKIKIMLRQFFINSIEKLQVIPKLLSFQFPNNSLNSNLRQRDITQHSGVRSFGHLR